MTTPILIIITVWVLFVSYRIIKKEKLRGAIVLSFIVVGLLIVTLAKKYGYREDIPAIVLAGMGLLGLYFYDKKKKNL